MPVPFPGFYSLILSVFGFLICWGGAPLMMQRGTKQRRIAGAILFICGAIFMGISVLLGKAKVG